MKIKNVIFATLSLLSAILMIVILVNWYEYTSAQLEQEKYYASIGALEVAPGYTPGKMSFKQVIFFISLCGSALVCIINALFHLNIIEFLKFPTHNNQNKANTRNKLQLEK